MVYAVFYSIGNSASSNPVVGVMINRWFQTRRPIATSVAVSGNATGQLVILGELEACVTDIGWRRAFGALGAVNLIIAVPLLLAAIGAWPRVKPHDEQVGDDGARPAPAEPIPSDEPDVPASVLGSGQFWLLVFLYAVCGFQDFFMVTHVVAFAQDQGIAPVLAGNVLALMGLMGLIGVISSGLLCDAFGAQRPTWLCFAMRIGIFALILADQGTPSIMVFALLYGFTFLMTAPLTVIFSRYIFGAARLGTVTGTISMVHQMFGGLGALVGALIFDYLGSYYWAFVLMLGLSIVSTALSPLLHRSGGAQVVKGA